jgi:hypothetical protein
MLAAYLNYPNTKISAHLGLTSAELQKHKKLDQRLLRLDTVTLSKELTNFTNKTYTFNASAAFNDMWLDIDFADPAFEMALLVYIQRLLAKYYTPFAKIEIEVHA